MCVIVYKPSNVSIDFNTLRDMWNTNSDGAGLAYFDKAGRVVVQKGYMTFKRLVKAVNELSDEEIVIHFRWATHGIKNSLQTHPFAISKDVMDAKAYSPNKRYKSVIFHNGIIDGYGDKKISDTIDFVAHTLSEIPKLQTRLDVLFLAGGKYILMDSGEFYFIGDFEEYKGLKCSNLNFIPMKIKKNTSKDYVKHDDDSKDIDFNSRYNLFTDINEAAIEDYYRSLAEEYKCNDIDWLFEECGDNRELKYEK